MVLGVSAAVSLLLAPVASANFFVPKSGGSPNADQISSLYKIILYMAAVVFVIVDALPPRHVNPSTTPTLHALARDGDRVRCSG